MTREPNFIQKFYEENFQKLEEEIKQSFNSELGPGDLPTKRDETKKLRAVIIPHDKYSHSGPCAAWAYKKLAESHFAKTYIIIGPNHKKTGTSLSIEDWKTPFGIIKNNKDLTRKISEVTQVPISESKHTQDHSIEVQLPFLQFINKDKIKELKIVPITISDDLHITKFSTDLHEALKDEDVIIIISSNFTHYGREHGYIPFEGNPCEKVKEMDKKTIKLIRDNDIEGLIDHLEETQSNICGQIPIIILMQLLKQYTLNLEMYYTSTEINDDSKNFVSYASITFK